MQIERTVDEAVSRGRAALRMMSSAVPVDDVSAARFNRRHSSLDSPTKIATVALNARESGAIIDESKFVQFLLTRTASHGGGIQHDAQVVLRVILLQKIHVAWLRL